MSDVPKPPTGAIGWVDLTVPAADGLRDFHAEVVGWKVEGLDLADLAASVAACRARGGEVVRDITGMGQYGRYAVIRDRSGAVAAMIQLAWRTTGPSASPTPGPS